MSEDSDHELSELDIENRTWNKLEKNMKLMGFREGAIEGKNLSLQEGFNRGYFDGFKLGEYIGLTKVIINCEFGLESSSTKKSYFSEEVNSFLTCEPCVLCVEEKKSPKSHKKSSFKNFEHLITKQQNHSSEIINTLKNLDLKSVLDKG